MLEDEPLSDSSAGNQRRVSVPALGTQFHTFATKLPERKKYAGVQLQAWQ